MISNLLKNIGKHSFVYSINYVMSSLAGILLLPVYTRFLSKSDYGTLSLIDQSIYYIKVVFFMGCAAAITRFYHFYESDKDKKSVVSTGIWFALISSSIGGTIMAIGSKPIAKFIFGESSYSLLIYLAAVILVSESLISVSMSYFAASKASLKYLSYGLLQLTIGIISNLYFIIILKKGAVGMVYGQALTNIILSIITTIHVLVLNKIKFDITKIKAMIRFGLPLVPATILAAIMHNADQYILRHYRGLEEVGIYSLGYKISFAANNVYSVSLGLIWGSAMIYEIHRQPDAKDIFAKMTTYLMSILIVLMFLVSMFSEQIMKILASSEYINAKNVLPLVCFGLIPYGMTAFMGIGINIYNKTWLVPIVNGIAASLNIILNFIFIPKYGYMGAASATVVTYFIYALSAWFIYRKVYHIPFEWYRLCTILTLSVLLFLLSNIINIQDQVMHILVKFGICLILPAVLYLVNFFNEDEKNKIYNWYLVIKTRMI